MPYRMASAHNGKVTGKTIKASKKLIEMYIRGIDFCIEHDLSDSGIYKR